MDQDNTKISKIKQNTNLNIINDEYIELKKREDNIIQLDNRYDTKLWMYIQDNVHQIDNITKSEIFTEGNTKKI